MYQFLTSLVFITNLAAAATTEIKLPKILECKWGTNQEDRLYTRLDNLTQFEQLPDQEHALTVWGDGKQNDEPKKDEVAFRWIGDYYKASISRSQYSYDLWTCDTEDRSYVFQTAELILPSASNQTDKHVKGLLIIGIREDESRHTLDCLAKY